MTDGLRATPPGSLLGSLEEWIEACREMGRGALQAAVTRDGSSYSVEIEDALDIFDRCIDHILSRVQSLKELG